MGQVYYIIICINKLMKCGKELQPRLYSQYWRKILKILEKIYEILGIKSKTPMNGGNLKF